MNFFPIADIAGQKVSVAKCGFSAHISPHDCGTFDDELALFSFAENMPLGIRNFYLSPFHRRAD